MKKLLFSILTIIVSASVAEAREQLKVVGSSTVYPFASFVAEEFGAVTRYPAPVIESTGTGGGMQLFCAGNGLDTPDISNASRRMKIKEYHLCDRNGVSDISEAMFGFDGIVIAQSNENETLNLTKEQILLAVAQKVPNKEGTALIDNPYKTWKDIDPALPDREIIVYGPPTSSGTRDAFEEMVMEYPTQEMKVYRDAGYKGYRIIRQDGAYVASGENDNLIVKKLMNNTGAFGIFGYSFLKENIDQINGISVDGVEPTPDTISTGEYPISRSLYFYIKNSHRKQVPAMDKYIEMFMSDELVGEDGILTDIGLITLPEELKAAYAKNVMSSKKLTVEELEAALEK